MERLVPGSYVFEKQIRFRPGRRTPPPGSGRTRKTSRGNCCIGSAAVSGARAVDRDQAATEITIEISAVWNITEAMPARLPDRARCGSRGAGNTRHNSERRAGEALASVESTGLTRPVDGIDAYSINPNRLAVTLGATPR